MKTIIGFEVDRDEHRKEWRLKLRYTDSVVPNLHQVKYIRYKDLTTLFAYLTEISGVE